MKAKCLIFVLDCRKTYEKENQKRRKEGVGNHTQKNFNAMQLTVFADGQTLHNMARLSK